MTQTLEKRANVVDTIDALLARVDQQKRAEANTEAGGYQGETSHPVKDVDDRTDDAQEGARSAENTSDVKDDQGSPAVDSTSPGTPGGQDSVQHNIGTQQSATGEDSAVETESAKGGKDDPGSSHPAKTDNDSLDGHKYSQARRCLQLIKSAQEQGTTLLAEIAVATEGELKKRAEELQQKAAEPTAAGDPSGASATPDSEPEAKHPPGKGEKKQADQGKQAGAEMAEAASEGQWSPEQIKQAQDEMIYGSLVESVQIAFDMADKTAAFIDAHDRVKAAAEDEEGSEESDEGGGAPPAGGEGGEGGPPVNPPEDLGGEMGGGLGGEEAALLDLLAQGEGGGEAGMPPEGGDIGGEAALAEMLGGAGGGAMGGEMGGAMGGEMGGEMGGGEPTPEDLAMLQAALAQAGVNGDALEAGSANKLAKALRKRASEVPRDWKPKTAAQAQALQRMVNYIREVTSLD